MNRREFLAAGLAASAGAATGLTAMAAGSTAGRNHFRLNYAPHFGMFRHSGGDDLLDQLHFISAAGFTALEDNGLQSKPVGLQHRIQQELERHGMQMGLFVGTADFGQPTFASGREPLRERIFAELRAAAATARRMNARWCSIIPGKFDSRLSLKQQTVNAIETLKYCVDICEPAGLTMVLEPLNHWGNRPQLFLHSVPQAFEICRAVGSPNCKILFDIYHQQLNGGNVMQQVHDAWPEIGYFQIGDNPGRKEPGTGTIRFQEVFRYIHSRGYQGILGMEHGNSLPGSEGEQAVLDAYLRHDRF